MPQKIYTVGMIGKRYKVPLSRVYWWRSKVTMASGLPMGRGGGLILLEGLPGHRYGFPEKIVDYFPQIPDKKTIQKILKDLCNED